ncbi:MAG: bifunctional phosphoribosylaminoimidazolecarboxamide formyltransferase/IMP cyclohydrolase [Christensenellales bacterium]
MIKRALISVSDKTGVLEFAQGLTNCGYEIISTGGTKKMLEEKGIKVIGISEITGFPECLDGRVKTLHPNVHAGLLARRDNPEHIRTLKELGINTIDIVAVNLYPFKQTIQKIGVTREEAIENIDIGGPTMLRSAAKNYKDVCVVCDPKDYEPVLNELNSGGVTLSTKFYLMYKVFQHTAVYDTLIANYMAKEQGIVYPDFITLAYEKAQDLRYGENPHQNAAFYKDILPSKGALTQARQLQGKELSFNNINDTNGAIELVKEFDRPTTVIVKHANPCGVASADTVMEAYQKAFAADSVSAYGGIVAVNGVIDKDTAALIAKIFFEIVVAPGYTDEAKEILKSKPNLRVLELADIGAPPAKGELNAKKVLGGMLMQSYDDNLADELKTVTVREAGEKQIRDLLFAMKVVKHVKSNAIVIAKDEVTLGIGPGQTNRIWAASAAVERSGAEVKGAVMASDAFFPFPDCVEVCARAGIEAIIQPGGSIRDNESIEMCNKHNIAMLFSGIRHFKH